PDAGQTVQNSASFEPVNGSPFGKSHGKIPVRPDAVVVDVHVKGTVHRLQVIELLVDFDRRIHVFGVEAEMAAGLPQIRPADMRRINQVVSGFQVPYFAVVLDDVANQSAFGVPQDKASADRVRIDAEEIKLLAQLAMISLLRFFQPDEI